MWRVFSGSQNTFLSFIMWMCGKFSDITVCPIASKPPLFSEREHNRIVWIIAYTTNLYLQYIPWNINTVWFCTPNLVPFLWIFTAKYLKLGQPFFTWVVKTLSRHILWSQQHIWAHYMIDPFYMTTIKLPSHLLIDIMQWSFVVPHMTPVLYTIMCPCNGLKIIYGLKC